MKLLLIGDPHLKISKFDLAKQFLSWIAKVVEEQRPDVVVNLGDTFDTHAIVRAEILCEFKRHVYDCLKHTGEYWYVPGNHDMFKPNDSTYHALKVFDDASWIKVFDKPTNYKDITIVPFQHDLTQFPLKTNPVCIAHQTFLGADFGHFRPEVGIKATDVSADIIISGHIHKRQTFDSVIYPGTPFSQSADDVNQIKGVMLFDTLTYAYSFIDCPLPRWHKLEIESSDFKPEDLFLASSNSNKLDKWILDITGPKAEIIALLDSSEYKKIVAAIDLRVITHYVDTDKQKVKIKSTGIGDILNEYVDKVYVGAQDKVLLKQKLGNLFAKSSS